MSGMSVPQPVAHNLARAKSLLKRDETIRALEAMLAGLDLYEPKKLMGKVRFEIEVAVQECVQELNRQPAVRKLFETLTQGKQASVPYAPGQEERLKALLGIIRKALTKSVAAKEQNAADVKNKRKELLQQKGLEYLKAGELPRGKAALRVLADEFGQEPGLVTQVAGWFLEYKLYFEAAELLEQAIRQFPKDSKAYGLATQCYKAMNDYDKLEAVYMSALKQFGKHPRTLLNLAKMYVECNKRELAFQTAQEAYNKDKSLTEAREIMEKFA